MFVTPLKQWSALIIVGSIIVLLLSQLPLFEQGLQHRRQAVAAFQFDKSKWLTDDNLVDAMSKLHLRERIAKVGWDHAILTVDLLGSEPDLVREDMGRLIVFAYTEVGNVKQVLIRVYSGDADRRRLLLSAETRKSEWTEKELSERVWTSMLLQDDEKTPNIRLSLTPSGKRWIANFSNS
ncbi:hypothetical protein [Cohnella lupini]|uniref:Uncharacterized protein n=1 Tax=Cohnella lupini TaxID=1294267 RepID=A0A3D9IFF8_9BACL|nr:hypothetical protein [Cohnella lupini]RED60450.1 hypothetical protein DFP95_106241 [Cohnella lupini]